MSTVARMKRIEEVIMMSKLIPALALVLAGCTTEPARQTPPAKTAEPKAVPAFKLQRCQRPLAKVMVVEDSVYSNAAVLDLYRQLQVPGLANIGRQMAAQANCFEVLDSDPLLLNVPGGVQPDFILRVRPHEVKPTAMSQQGGIWSKLKAYLASYSMGAVAAPPLKIDSAAMTIALVCHKQKRVAKEFAGAETEARALKEQGPTLDWGPDKPNINGSIVARAYVLAQNQLVHSVATQANFCAN